MEIFSKCIDNVIKPTPISNVAYYIADDMKTVTFSSFTMTIPSCTVKYDALMPLPEFIKFNRIQRSFFIQTDNPNYAIASPYKLTVVADAKYYDKFNSTLQISFNVTVTCVLRELQPVTRIGNQVFFLKQEQPLILN